MAKKKKGLSLGKILGFVVALLGLVAICMVFVDAVTTGDKEVFGVTVEGVKYSGIKLIFGVKENDMAVLSFSFMALIPVILVLAGTVLSVLNALKDDAKLVNFIIAGMFVVAGVLYFIMPNFMVFADTLAGAVAKELEFKLAVGSIIAGICSVLAGVISLAKPFLKK